MEASSNPFAVLSLIVAPAILTNASSVRVMSTSNRVARAVDRARELSKQLESPDGLNSPDTDRRLRELSAAEQRAVLLLKGLRSFYLALGGFASATLISLLGAVVVPVGDYRLVRSLEIIGVFAGLLAVGAIVNGSALLLKETRIAVRVLTERITALRVHVRNPDTLSERP
jgi:hypothetical protein